MVENHGATHEAVEEVWLMYSHHLKRGEVSADSLPSVRVRLTRERGDLPPRRNVRQTVDVLAAQFLEQVPEEITAMVTLESGERITTEALPIAKQGYETALGRPLRGPR